MDKPAADETIHYYTGHEITYLLPENALYTVTGHKQTEVGTYTVTVTLKPYTGLSWSDGTTDPATYTFTISEMSDEAAAQLAAAFAARLEALGDAPVFPLCKPEVDGLAADYEVLHDKVKALLADAKATLDTLKTVSDKYVELEVVFDSVKLQTKLNGYETYYLVIYNPNDTEGQFVVQDGHSWANVVVGKAAPQAWSQFILPYASAVQGDNYMVYNGANVGLTSGGWQARVYGYVDADATAASVGKVVDAVEALSVGSLTTADEAAVIVARDLYNALSDYAKTQVPTATVDRLTTAEAEMVTVKNRAAADAVTALVDALTDESSAEDVVAAKAAYDALTDAQKAFVTEETVSKLNAQVARVEEAVITAKAAAFKAKADALGETPTFPLCKPEVDSLVAEYETLDEKVKARLADTKATLDALKATADKYTKLTVTFGSDRIMTALPGYETYYLVIHSPTDNVEFYYAGVVSNWDAVGKTTLKFGYNQVEYDIRFAKAGNAYVYGGGKTINFNDKTGEWKDWTCVVYGYKADSSDTPTVRVALSVGGTTDDPTYGKVLTTNVATGGYLENWGSMTAAQLEALAAYEDVHFYIYNPNDFDVTFFFQSNDDPAWSSHDSTVCKAREWTKISLSEVFDLPEGATLVYVDVGIKDANNVLIEGFVFEGWMITDFYGTK